MPVVRSEFHEYINSLRYEGKTVKLLWAAFQAKASKEALREEGGSRQGVSGIYSRVIHPAILLYGRRGAII